MDYRATVINCLTANHPLAAAIPVHFASDREVIESAIGSVGLNRWKDAKVAWIIDTLHLEYIGDFGDVQFVTDGSPCRFNPGVALDA